MKKRIGILLMIITSLVLLTFAIAGCDPDGQPPAGITDIRVISSGNITVNEDGVAYFKVGDHFVIDESEYKVEITREDDSKEEIGLDDARVSYYTDLQNGELTQEGHYVIYFDFVDGENVYCDSITVLVERWIDKPELPQTQFEYTGQLQGVETDVPHDYVLVNGQTMAIDVGKYSVTYDLASMSRWSDGTTGPITVEWEITQRELQKSVLPKALKYVFDGDTHYFDTTIISSLYDYVLNESEYRIVTSGPWRNAGVYEVEFRLLGKNNVFTDGTSVETYQYEVLPHGIKLPTIKSTTQYGESDWSSAIDGSYDQTFYYISGHTAERVGKYQVRLELQYPENTYFYREISEDQRFTCTESVLTFDWEVLPIRIPSPTFGETQLPWNMSYQFPEVDLHGHDYEVTILADGDELGATYQEEVGSYRAVFRLYDDNYVWDETGKNEDIVLDWEIIKAEMTAPELYGQFSYEIPYGIKVQKTFTANDVCLPNTHELSVYTEEEKLPIYDASNPIEWRLETTETKDTYTQKTYKFTDSDSIIWIKTQTDYNDGTQSFTFEQTLDMAAKSIGDTQIVYTTNFSRWENVNDKPGLRTELTVSEKGTRFVDFDMEAIKQRRFVYGDPLNLDYKIKGNTDDGAEVKIVLHVPTSGGAYRAYSFDNDDELYINTYVGEALLYYTCTGSTMYEDIEEAIWYDYTHMIEILPRAILPEEIITVEASAIKLNEQLSNSVIAGVVKPNGRQVLGSFTWINDTVRPAMADGGETLYEFLFTPQYDCYEPVRGRVAIGVNKGDVVVDEDTMLPSATTYGDYLCEGDLIEDIVLGDRNEVNNILGEKISGKWEVVAGESERIGEEFALKFTPDDSDFYNCYQTEPSTWLYFKLKEATIKEHPIYIVNLTDKVDYMGGKISVTYENLAIERIFSLDEIDVVIKNDLEVQYVVAGGLAVVESSFDHYYEANKKEDIYAVFDNHSAHDVVYINEDIVVDEEWWDSTSSMPFREHVVYVVKEGVTLTFEKLSKPGSYYGTRVYEDVEGVATYVFNYGTLNVNKAYGNLIMYNMGTVKIDYCSTDYLGVYNGKDCLFEIADVLGPEQMDESVGDLHQNGYDVVGALHNEGTFKFLYYPENEEDDTIVFTKEYKPTFVIADESYNSGTIMAQIAVCAPLTMDAGSELKTFTLQDAEGRLWGYDVLHTGNAKNFDREDDQPIKFIVHDNDDFYLAVQNCYFYSERANVQVYVQGDIDVSEDERFNTYTTSGIPRIPLKIAETCMLKIEKGATLSLGDKVLGLCSGYEYPDSVSYIPCAALYNYGTINGDVKYAVKTGWVVQNTQQQYYIYNYGTINGEILAGQ